MKVREIIETNLIKGNTTIVINDNNLHIITSGKWFEDNIFEYRNHEAEAFTWKNNNRVIIIIKNGII